ncbi:DUF1858 domain-containing protein [Heliobacterium chlorum]|uniref:DUF1858 domain-containing protein n=1 Tax=Heliobacterium chlorum TaxID=2698 RepID=A0ABR7T5G4_HELCL|nr:DUF1858 domain-containing protein [Heliobacterium chlorum]MBC9785472.1 DUF1858 domain-containing protein [Heliobacterium chlorum]
MITKDMMIGEVVSKYPETVPVFRSFGMQCLGCPSARNESVEKAAGVHGFDADRLLEALNEAIKK